MIYKSVDFDGQRVADYTLLVQTGEHRRALAIVDDAQQLKFAATYSPSRTEKAIADVLGYNFGTIKLAVSDSRYTYIPSDVFDEAHMHTYLQYIQDDGMGEPALVDIPRLGIKLLYQTNRLDGASMEKQFPAVRRYPAVQALLYGITKHGLHANDPLIVIDKQLFKTTICFFNSGKFIYSNDFEVRTVDDLTYYLLAVFRHLGINDGRLMLYISGDVDQGDPYYERASAYGKVVLADSGMLTGISVPESFVPHQHRFLTLFGLNLCG